MEIPSDDGHLKMAGQEAPEATQESTPEAQTDQGQDDILSRVAKWQSENKPNENIQIPEDFKFDYNEIQKIEDPTAKEVAEKAYKSFEKGFQKKFQELADIRKSMEAQQQPTQWTVDKVQELINDPEFVQVAQQVAGQQPEGGTDDYSALSDAEKAKISNLESELAQIRKRETDLYRQQQHAQLQQKYPDYKPDVIDTISADLIAGKRQANYEDLYWAVYGREKAEAAYKMGLQDARAGNVEKFNLSSPEGDSATPSNESFKRTDGESSKDLWRKIAKQTMNSLSQKTTVRR